MSLTLNKLVPFNEVEGIASTNVPAYSNKYSGFSRGGRHYQHGVFTGYQWQCVEFARRWLLMRKSCTFRDIPCACNMWADLPYIERVTDGRRFRLRAVANGSPEPPKKDSLLIYDRDRKMPYGHVAIITDVTSDHVHIAEQNNLYYYWPGDYARRERLIFANGGYYIEDEDPIYGWMEIEDSDQLQPFNESNGIKILQQYIEPASID
jgi:trypanothione synthetase/amidase